MVLVYQSFVPVLIGLVAYAQSQTLRVTNNRYERNVFPPMRISIRYNDFNKEAQEDWGNRNTSSFITDIFVAYLQ